MRSTDPVAAARAFVAAGRAPVDPANVDRRPFVKICGVTDAAGALAAVRAGADAIGLNLVAGTPRALDARGGGRAGPCRPLGGGLGAGRTLDPAIVAVTADADDVLLRDLVAALDPDAIQFNGTESPARLAGGAPPGVEGPARAGRRCGGRGRVGRSACPGRP